jgi:glycosyltransferase involved in cell wall biosynthesis
MVTTISVAMTTYNGEPFLGEQLRSIAAQKRLPDELVVADDLSTDRTWEILEDFARIAPFPVRLHRNEPRLGWRDNFMSVLPRCQSELIALCDQDDVWDHAKLAIAEQAMDESDALLFFHDAWLIDCSGKRIGAANIFSLRERNPPLSVYSFYSPYGFSMVCHRSLLILSDLWDQSTDSNDRRVRAPHDQWLFFLATVLGTVRFSEERLTGYRQHASNAVGQPVPPGLVSRLRRARHYWLSNPEARFRNLAAVSRDRANVLGLCCDRLSGVWHQRAALGRARYLELASRMESRAELYGKQPATARMQCLQRMRQDGLYCGASVWDFTRAALIKDALLGVALQPLLV